MKNTYSFFGLTLFAMNAFCATPASSQDSTKKVQLKVTADLVSSYVWRGVKATNTPNFQPTMAIVKNNFEAGVWGSTDFSGDYKEVDLNTSYTIGALKMGVTDYNWTFQKPYFGYRHSNTDHIIEGSLSFLGTSTMPLSVSVNTMFYGSDKKSSNPNKNAYSTYIELGYPISSSVSLFMGATPGDGYYGDGYGKSGGFAFVNLGVTGTRSLKISDVYSLPIKATFGVNPQQEDLYLVFGITF
ncbi:MAG: hypothetical protein Q8862_00590 [Bacteroidota bacterium]|nr:hypothetical protein [Bacteroidota bacterium]